MSRIHSGVSSFPWSSPMSSLGILPRSSYQGQQCDPSYKYHYQTGQFGEQRPIYPLNTGMPPYGQQYAYSPHPQYQGGQPYGYVLLYSGQPEMKVCQWQQTMPLQPRLMYPTQPMQTEPIISTIPVVTMEPQIQAQLVVSQPVQVSFSTSQPQVSSQQTQTSQAVMKQPLVSGVQLPQVSVPLSGVTQVSTGLFYPQPGQIGIGGHYQTSQSIPQQPW